MKTFSWIPVVVVMFLVGCQSEQNKQSQVRSSDFFEVDDQAESKSSQMNYRIPTPIDLFLLIESSGGLFIEEVLNSPHKRMQYSSTASKAMNFGVYSTDLAYCSVFADFQGALVYFNTAKELAVELGLLEGYGETMAYRINNNLSNIDSLIEISTDSYYQVTSFLSDQGMSDVMALIMTGCWLESTYLTVESVKEFDENDPLVERVADQKYLLDNLIHLIKANTSSISLDEVLNHLLDLQEVYDPLYLNDEEVIITKQQYVRIVNKIKEVRSEIIG